MALLPPVIQALPDFACVCLCSFVQVLPVNCLPHFLQVILICPLPLGTRSCCPHSGHLKYLYSLRSDCCFFLIRKNFLIAAVF